MSKSLNFNNVKKRYLTVTLSDENNTTILVSSPTKKILTSIVSLQDSIANVETDGVSVESLDDMYCICANIMNHNKAGIKIDKELLEDIFDFEDITIFLNAYMDFINEETLTKN